LISEHEDGMTEPKKDEFAAYLDSLIVSTQADLASLDAAHASVNAQTEGLRHLMTALEENEAVREQLFRWIADHRPRAFAKLASADARWGERLIRAIQSERAGPARPSVITAAPDEFAVEPELPLHGYAAR
jgi:hypothetical protein